MIVQIILIQLVLLLTISLKTHSVDGRYLPLDAAALVKNYESSIEKHYIVLKSSMNIIEQRKDISTQLKERAKERLINLHVNKISETILLESKEKNGRKRRRKESHLQSGRKLLMEQEQGMSEDEVGSALTEPTPECRRILNVWTAKCVFGT